MNEARSTRAVRGPIVLNLQEPANPVRVAFVGLGAISRAYDDAIRGVDSLEVVAGVDPRGDAAERFGRERDVPTFSSVAAFVGHMRADAAVVMTPPSTHEELCVRLLEAGIHVLCEKPLSVAVDSAERMARAAERSSRALMMASKFRYVDDVVGARDQLERSTIGQLLLFENVFCSRCDMTGRWNSDPAIAGGGVLIDNGSHSVDIARFLCGPLARIQAQFGINVQPVDVEDTARILFESESGVMGTIDLSWSLHKEVSSYVRLYGSDGTLEVGWRESRVKRQGEADWTVIGDGYDKVAALRSQLADFAEHIRSGSEPRISLDAALWSVRAIEAAYESARANKWVPVGS